ncbi:hypothetical protein [Chryseobacterium populi]|uniref:Glycosyl/glycerophosphate transferase, teichoic acid biosynthesis n=1 Tax=Chryseobacterium populi TaxID=1144316 RepID=J3CN87_9FLAO|nr:hypothetical protein [Chryseobacterium populi]EJL74906.1 hypothetical protein PMI13_00786 [Chryseobacterium populi]
MKKIINKLITINLYPFVLNIDFQKKILKRYNNPKDLIERSFFQYKVQFDVVPFYKKIINNIIGFFAIFYFFLKGILKQNNLIKDNLSTSKKVAIFPYKNYHYPNIIPIELKDEFHIQEINFMEDFLFKKKDFKFILNFIKKYPLHFYFLSKCISKIMFYRYIIERYKPSAIISSAEYSFSSSISTQFCRENNIEQINIMHGEKFFIIKDSFFEFDRFYIWDEFYKDLFINLKASSNQFIIGNFPNLKMDVKPNQEKYKYTYYLAAENQAELSKIKESLLKIENPEKICIRFHPRYSDFKTVKQIFEGFVIENPKETTMEESFSRTENVISLYSSCLVQAYFNQKNIIVDDVNNSSDKLKILKDSEYIILSKPHQLLSAII